MLQRATNDDRLNIDVKTPISRPIAPKAKKLAGSFQKNYGPTDHRETVARLAG